MDRIAAATPQRAFATSFGRFILSRRRRLAMPIGAYTGLELTGDRVRDVVSRSDAQVKAVLALHDRFDTQVLLTAMDLSAEAETFGCEVRLSDDEIPTVTGRRATSLTDVLALPAPAPGDGRTHVHLEAARRLVAASGGLPVLGGLIGPFSLAGRIFGVSEALEATMAEPDTILALLERVTSFLCDYALAFRDAGASGVVMAEPAAGLLSPRSLATFSAPFVRHVVSSIQTSDFAVVLHNCAAKIAHLAPTLESGAEVYHFGAPMDLPEALRRVAGEVVLCGNLDPTAVLHDGSPETVFAEATRLLEAAAGNRAFVLSSGCDLPPGTPQANLEAFYQATREA